MSAHEDQISSLSIASLEKKRKMVRYSLARTRRRFAAAGGAGTW
jgi:hypothetical protein